jgi:hypothetical protein
MANEMFFYKELSHAENDLKLFSRMNAHEDKPLYLVNMVSGMVIVNSVEHTYMGNNIEAIGLNGTLYTIKRK